MSFPALRLKHQLYLRIGVRMVGRFRWRIWWNFLLYLSNVRRARERGRDRLPYFPPNVAIWVTNRCNKHCHFCTYLEELNPSNHRQYELSFDRFRELLELPTVRHSLRLALYGGEPLLNRQLPEMIRYAKSRGHLVTVNTNGLLVKQRWSDLVEAAPDLLSISYYPEDRDSIEEAIGLAAKHLPVIINYLYSEERLAGVEQVVRCGAEKGAWAVKFETYDQPGAHGEWGITPGRKAMPAPPRDEVPIWPEDLRLQALRADLQRRYGDRILLIWPEPPQRAVVADQPSCRMFWHSTWLDAQGRTSPCCVWPIAAFAGNAFEEDDAWNSQRMLQLRRNMRAGAYPKICSTCSHLHDDTLGI